MTKLIYGADQVEGQQDVFFCPIFYFFVAGFCLRFVEERLRVIANSPRR